MASMSRWMPAMISASKPASINELTVDHGSRGGSSTPSGKRREITMPNPRLERFRVAYLRMAKVARYRSPRHCGWPAKPSHVLFVPITDDQPVSRGGCRTPALVRSPPQFRHRFDFFGHAGSAVRTHKSTNSLASPRHLLDSGRDDSFAGRLDIHGGLGGLPLVQDHTVGAHQLEQVGLSLGHRLRGPLVRQAVAPGRGTLKRRPTVPDDIATVRPMTSETRQPTPSRSRNAKRHSRLSRRRSQCQPRSVVSGFHCPVISSAGRLADRRARACSTRSHSVSPASDPS